MKCPVSGHFLNSDNYFNMLILRLKFVYVGSRRGL
jgi:hypothetical protein